MLLYVFRNEKIKEYRIMVAESKEDAVGAFVALTIEKMIQNGTPPETIFHPIFKAAVSATFDSMMEYEDFDIYDLDENFKLALGDEG